MVSEARFDPALTTLLEMYNQRLDLQEVYPEVANEDFRRLIDWAAGVSANKWKDHGFAILQPFAEWYADRFTGTPPHVEPQFPMIVRTSVASANPLPLLLSVMADVSADDISHHLPILSMLITEFNLKQIVELGTRNGNSTLVLLEAAKRIGGRVMSVDVEPCLEARRRVMEAGLNDSWRFLEGDDLELGPSDIPPEINLLFIDTNHIYIQTISELRKFLPYLAEGSWIALHDYVSFVGVNRAVQEFVEILGRKVTFYPFLSQNGFALIRLGASNQLIDQPDGAPSQMVGLPERVAKLEERVNRYVNLLPLRWMRRLRAAIHGHPPPH
jgi:predicted O-methyltransferase YrrM